MGMKWVRRYWVYDDGKKQRRINYNDRNSCWEFEDGTRPDRVTPGLKDISGHWESSDGKTIDPTQMKPLDIADALHGWASKLGIEAVKLGLNATEQSRIIRKYGELFERAGPLLRKESDLPLDKKLLRIELAKALLRPELTSEMKNSLSIAFANLEFFLPEEEFETVGAALKFIGDPEIKNYLNRASQSGVPPSEAKAFAQTIVNNPGDPAVWQNIVTRYGERRYQTAVLKFIASGNHNPSLAQLVAAVDAEAKAASHA
jgi:hypothetical protein